MRAVGGISKFVAAVAAAALMLAVATVTSISPAAAGPIPCILQTTNGPVDTCQLSFTRQPADAQKNTTITSVAGNPAGAPVQVKVNNTLPPGPQAGVTVTLTPNPGATISGNVAVSDANGLATFPALKIVQEGRFTLTATATGSTSATSNGFTTYDDTTFCPANTTCTASASDGTTSVDVTVPPQSGSGAVLVSMGIDNVSCGGPANGVATVDSTFSGSGTKSVTIRVDKSIVKPLDPGGASKFDVCYQTNVSLPTGQLLPDCGTAPCVNHRSKNQAGDAIIELLVPLGDPKFGWCVDGTTTCI
jgi:hypothetical protein